MYPLTPLSYQCQKLPDYINGTAICCISTHHKILQSFSLPYPCWEPEANNIFLPHKIPDYRIFLRSSRLVANHVEPNRTLYRSSAIFEVNSELCPTNLWMVALVSVRGLIFLQYGMKNPSIIVQLCKLPSVS